MSQETSAEKSKDNKMDWFWESIKEEFGAMVSGKFVKYHMAAWVLPIVVAIFFSVVMNHAQNYEGRIAVIDADASKFSTELIEKLHTSPFIEVTEVVHCAVKPEPFLHIDRNFGVLYLPKGLEKAVKRGDKDFKIGYFADTTNIAQNGQIISTLGEVLPEIQGMLLNSAGGAEAGSSNLMAIERILFNPSYSSTITFTITFVYFFSTILLCTTMCMMIGRLKVTGMWYSKVRDRGVFGLVARVIPYALIYTTVVTCITAVLLNFGQLRFSGNYLYFLPSLFMTGMCVGILSCIITWDTTNPGQGSSRMTYIVPPGFIMGGTLLATGFFDHTFVYFKWLFPLAWQFSFWRDFALREAKLSEMIGSYGSYIVYMSILTLILTIFFFFEFRKTEEAAPPLS